MAGSVGWRAVQDVVFSYRGRKIGLAEVAFLREIIAQNPTLSRCALSVRVCQAWQWARPNGTLCDMVCRSLMLELHRAGWIELPPPRRAAVNNAIKHRRVGAARPVDKSPLEGPLSALGTLEIRQVRRTADEGLFGQLLSEHHYLGYSRPVGEHLKYLVWAGERPVACLAWSSATRQLGLRDRFLGKSQGQRIELSLIAYNSRYLILPWVRVPHLASHLLGCIARRISRDWQELYAHPICLLESFVDTERFGGVCYRAANWICVGRSQGRGTKALTHERTCSRKDLWVYPLSPQYRRHLLSAS